MSLNDPLANALSVINHREKAGKKQCRIKPTAKIIKRVFAIMKENRYLGEFKEIDDGRGGFMQVQLIGAINGCGVIKPRFAIRKDEFTKFEKRYLLAKDFGMLIISTPKGMMGHAQAKKLNCGGRLIAYCY